MKRPLREGWLSFLEQMPPDGEPEQVDTARHVFYMGAICLFLEFVERASAGEAAIRSLLDELGDELNEYRREVKDIR